MAKSSIHIAAGNSGYFAHNSRETPTQNSIFSDEKNFCSCKKSEAFEMFRKKISEREKKYTERTGQKLHKKTITHLSAILNLNQNHGPKDVRKVVDFLEKSLDTQVIQFAIHRDEGHIDLDKKVKKNNHAHIEFLGLDSTGASIRRKLSKKFLIDLQTKVAELLKMERGRNYVAEKAKRPKRLDTYEYKKFAEEKEKVEKKEREIKWVEKEANQYAKDVFVLNNVNTDKMYPAHGIAKYLSKQVLELNAKTVPTAASPDKTELKEAKTKITTLENIIIKNGNENEYLKDEIKKIREELKLMQAIRTDYAKMEQKNKDLLTKIEKKELDKNSLNAEIEQLRNSLKEEITKRKELETAKSVPTPVNTDKTELEAAKIKINVLENVIADLRNAPAPEPKIIEKFVKNEEQKRELEEAKNKIIVLENIISTKDKNIEELKQKMESMQQEADRKMAASLSGISSEHLSEMRKLADEIERLKNLTPPAPKVVEKIVRVEVEKVVEVEKIVEKKVFIEVEKIVEKEVFKDTELKEAYEILLKMYEEKTKENHQKGRKMQL